MMVLLRALVATAFLLSCTLLPFLPGRHDPLAVPLSMMAWVFGKVGLFLVPVGVLGLLVRSRRITLVARIAGSLVVLAMSIAALAFSGFALGIAFIVLSGAAIWAKARRSEASPARSTSLLLVVVPVAVALLQWALLDPVTEWSRLRSIDSCAGLIADIERYRAEWGRYPLGLQALNQDCDDPLRSLGVRGYAYEPHGEAFHVLFEHPSFELGVREVVVYNPLDEQVVTSHDSDILRWSPAELEVRRSFQSAHAAGRPHWKYFWFD